MSADNGIYILRTLSEKEGEFEYRVVHTQCIENIHYFPEGSKEWEDTLLDYFGQCIVYNDEEGAWKEAKKIYDDIMNDYFGILEYGISTIHMCIKFPKRNTNK